MNLTKVRVNEILDKFKSDYSLFNWCDEYNTFVNANVVKCVSSEVEFMLNQSLENDNSPISYEELNEKIRENVTDEQIKERLKEKGQLNNLTDTEDNEYSENYENAREELINEVTIYEYWVVSDDFAYWLEDVGVIMYKGYWCRETTGQSVSLDNCVINAFIKMLKVRFSE